MRADWSVWLQSNKKPIFSQLIDVQIAWFQVLNIAHID